MHLDFDILARDASAEALHRVRDAAKRTAADLNVLRRAVEQANRKDD